jgi:Zn-dependent peptidase ImmA (M78 family)/transcriptional regulator with XRE-family HTH domain
MRVFHGLTQKELSSAVSASEAAIWQIERGKEPNEILREALGVVLGVGPLFFYDKIAEEFTETECNFRKGSTSAERIRKRVLAQGSLFAHVVEHLQARLKWPEYNVPFLPAQTDEEVAQRADACRKVWGLGLDTPITHMGKLLENCGVMVTRLRDDESAKLDAFSRRGADGKMSYVVLNPAKGSASRARFDMAHELGHLVLHHPDQAINYLDREHQADIFASAFLLPRVGFRREFRSSRSVNWDNVFELKARWKVSAQAIVYRAYRLHLIDAVEFRRAYKTISARGWLKLEPQEPPHESPALFRTGLQTLWQRKKLGAADIANELHWNAATFEAVTGLTRSTNAAPSDEQTDDVISLADRRKLGPETPHVRRRYKS